MGTNEANKTRPIIQAVSRSLDMNAHLNDGIRVRLPDKDSSRNGDSVLFKHLGKVLAARGVEKLVSLLKTGMTR